MPLLFHQLILHSYHGTFSGKKVFRAVCKLLHTVNISQQSKVYKTRSSEFPDRSMVHHYQSDMNMLYVTGCWKTDQIVTLGLFDFIGPANTQLHSYTTHIQCHCQAWLTGLLFQSKFCRPCKFMTETIGPKEGTTWKVWV